MAARAPILHETCCQCLIAGSYSYERYKSKKEGEGKQAARPQLVWPEGCNRWVRRRVGQPRFWLACSLSPFTRLACMG